MRNVLQNFKNNVSGTALVEFGILIPVLFPLFFGMMEYGRLIYQHHIAEKGIKNAARYLARVVDDTGCALNSSSFATAKTQAKNLAVYGGFDSNVTPSVSNWSTGDVDVNIDCETNGSGTWRGEEDIPLITVSTSFTYSDLGFLAVLGQSNVTVSVSHQELFVGG